MKGATPVILILGLIIIVAAIVISYGSMTGFVLFNPNQGAGSNASATGSGGGLVIGDAVPRVTGSLSGAQQNETQTEAQTGATQQNKTTNKTTTAAGSTGGGSIGSGGGSSSPPSCSDECSVGQKRCKDSNYAETCGNYDSDSCLEWGTGEHCEYSCSGGECAAEDSSVNWTNISISPQITNAEKGSIFTISANISTLKYVYAAEIFLRFDPTIVNATNVTEGGFLKKDGVSTFPVITINNTGGYLMFANTRMGTQVVSGTGTLFNVTFNALENGTSSLVFEKITMANAELGSISSIHAYNGTVNVG